MRNRYDRQLRELDFELQRMGDECRQIILEAVAKVGAGEPGDIAGVIAREDLIDQENREIEGLCIEMLLKQQPVASDLNKVSACLKMITDLERIGDQALGIAEVASRMSAAVDQSWADEVGSMAKVAAGMVSDAMTAYGNRDVALAEYAISCDDKIDELFVEVKTSLVNSITVGEVNGEDALDLLLIAKYLERIGDHAVNVAEWVVFGLTGKHPQDQGA